MSAEVEKESKDEEIKEQQQKKSFKEKIQENWQIAAKLIELLLCAGCVGFVYEPARAIGLGKNHLTHFGIMYTSFTGYMLINMIMLIARCLRDRIPYKTATLICVCGATLFTITAILLALDINEVKRNSFHPNQYRQVMMVTAVIIAAVNTVVFSFEAWFTYRCKQDF